MTLYDRYIEEVCKNPDNYNDLVKLSVNRHLNDLKKKNYKYYFDRDEADKVIRFIKLLKHTSGSFMGKNFDLQPYQAFITSCLYGWKNKETGKRRFQKAYIETPRKSGKSEYAAALEIYSGYYDSEGAAQVYTVATKSDQADHVYRAVTSMCTSLKKDSKAFAQRCKIMQYVVKDIKTNSFIKKLTSDSKTEDGANPHMAVIDEYHAHVDDSMLKVIETGVASREQPLILIITTAGFNKYSACYSFRKIVVDTLEGKLENESLFGIIWTLDEKDDWNDSKTWVKVNPNYGNTPKHEVFEGLYLRAVQEGGTSIVEFKTKNLNIWVDSAKVWINDKDWMLCEKHIDESELINETCIIGMDLSSKVDLTAVTYYFPKLKYIKTDYYAPESKINGVSRIDGVDYREWEHNGLIKITNGNVIDYEFIVKDVLYNCEKYEVQLIAYDPYNSDLIIPKFEELEIKCGAIRQGYLSISPPTKRLEVEVLKKNIFHDGNQITRWMMGNIEITNDAHGNIKIDKGKSSNKVDGPVSIVTALGGYMHLEINQENTITLEDIENMMG